MTTRKTWCEDCEHVDPDSRKGPSRRWLCRMHKRCGPTGHVTRDSWDKEPPFLYCKDVNGGACATFKRKRGSQMELPS